MKHIVAALFIVIALSACENKPSLLDGYKFQLPSDIIEKSIDEHESVLLTLRNEKGGSLVVQNKNYNLKASIISSDAAPKDIIKQLHLQKFSIETESSTAYEVSPIEIVDLDKLSYTQQSFTYRQGTTTYYSILSIVKLGSGYYPIYYMNVFPDIKENNKLILDLINSLNDNMLAE